MSRNRMPGLGKSGMVRTSDARSRSGWGGRAIMSSQSPFPSPYGSMLLVSPDVPVRQIGQHREDEQEEEDGIADLDTLDQLRLGGPDEERGDVLGHLIDRRLGAVGIGHLPLGQRRSEARRVGKEGVST